MQRESFIFYRSFFDAIQPLPADMQLQVLRMIASYGLDGTTPDGLDPVAQSIFMLIKPIIDANTKNFTNGKRGGRPKKRPYKLSFADEAQAMTTDTEWCAKVMADHNLTDDQLKSLVDDFTKVCQTHRHDRPHEDLGDAKSHFVYWLSKIQNPSNDAPQDTPPDYSFSGGFGGLDT